ncbi:hypothetical protein [Actinomadura sp. WMMB 499]|uniref:hypothetical protein n=1 Tax=Actinomadura sp. WMMB 499 TaxID=1219491 RepID=UPI0012439EE9|nr:hypothetical protein [Actinomadura sp. WMMB 499]QFG22900.1 hypothetical protein F7P10_19045 [Actinomadura sp. WMMB 499]
MHTEAEQTAKQLLTDMVSDELLALYTRLLRIDGCLREEAANLLDGPEQVEALIGAGSALVRSSGPGTPAQLVPTRPDLALQGLLVELSRRMVADQDRLLTGQRRMSTMHLWPSSMDGSADGLVQVIVDRDQISRVARGLISSASFEWLTLDNQSVERPMDELTAVPPPPSFDGHVRCRAIYESACAEHPVGLKTIEIAVEAGEEARLLPRLGMKMKIADESIALLPLTPTGMTGALLIRSPVIIGALREYFEFLWERAVPFGAASPLSDMQKYVLNMMVEDVTVEQMAKRAGVSVPTIRRHSTAIRNMLGVDLPFAAGAAAVRRGWVK